MPPGSNEIGGSTANSISTTTLGSTSALPPTPSPVVSAYKGKRGTAGVGREFYALLSSLGAD